MLLKIILHIFAFNFCFTKGFYEFFFTSLPYSKFYVTQWSVAMTVFCLCMRLLVISGLVHLGLFPECVISLCFWVYLVLWSLFSLGSSYFVHVSVCLSLSLCVLVISCLIVTITCLLHCVHFCVPCLVSQTQMWILWLSSEVLIKVIWQNSLKIILF